MIKFKILDTEIRRTEFRYLYVWQDKYECVDARYVNINSSRDSALYNYKIYVWKIWYLNTDCSEDDLVADGIRLIENAMKTHATYLLESDVYKICSEIFNNEFNSELFNKIKTKKQIEWKSNLSDLIKFTEEEEDYLYKLSKDLFLKEANNMIKNKKIRESIKCLNSLKMDKTKRIILDSITSIKEEKKTCSISDLSQLTGMSYNTVKKYYEEYMEEFTLDEYMFVVNKNNSLKDEKMNCMKEAINNLKKSGLSVNRINVSKYSGISRNTVNKRWEELNDYLNKFSL
jgi:DNA-binding transcriptional regulator YhcF (GntR family)